MAVGATLLTSGNDPAITTSPKTTASVTVASGAKCVVLVCLVNGTTGRTATVTRTTGGATFNKEDEGTFDTLSDSLSIHTLDGPFTDTLVITQNNSIQQMHWAVVEVTGLDGTTPFPQTSGVQIGTGTTFTAPLGSPVDATNNRSLIVTAHKVFQGTSPGTGMTELADSPANSPATSFNVSWSNTAWEANPSVTGATGAAWGALSIELNAAAVGGTNYSDTVDVNITATTPSSDLAARVDTVDVSITATTPSSDVAARVDTVQVTITATTPSSDVAARVDTVDVNITATTPSSDVWAMVDSFDFVINASIPSTDSFSGASANYSDTVDVGIAATVTVTDVLAMAEVVQVNITATTPSSDVRTMAETVQVTITATTPSTDTAQRADVVQINILGSTPSSDSLSGQETANVVATVTTPSTDQLAAVDTVLIPINATVTVVDLFVDGSIPPFVILVGPPFTPWSVLEIKHRWAAAPVVDNISEGP